ncbi:NADH-quinone oxidoreductase subunit C/D [Escherichia coli]|uniref:NADH-quinone oxidoreductase subunit C/D n=1 Tax=Escherichia coli TaxID=562 RepID=A0A377DGY5_ECOLX|nr:NADH-quinone oxidoreductase subunit C/D [Escherichia coli]
MVAFLDCYTRVMLKVEELRQSLRILEQCLNNMPEGPFKADHPLTTPPPKERTLQHIETLITHFLQVSWGPVMPANESFQMIEATKGINSYYLTSDGSTMSYRTRVRTPSFAHLQQIPAAIRGSLVSDLMFIWAVSILLCQMWTANYARESNNQNRGF